MAWNSPLQINWWFSKWRHLLGAWARCYNLAVTCLIIKGKETNKDFCPGAKGGWISVRREKSQTGSKMISIPWSQVSPGHGLAPIINKPDPLYLHIIYSLLIIEGGNRSCHSEHLSWAPWGGKGYLYQRNIPAWGIPTRWNSAIKRRQWSTLLWILLRHSSLCIQSKDLFNQEYKKLFLHLFGNNRGHAFLGGNYN